MDECKIQALLCTGISTFMGVISVFLCPFGSFTVILHQQKQHKEGRSSHLKRVFSALLPMYSPACSDAVGLL
jgi:hypothetical protein